VFDIIHHRRTANEFNKAKQTPFRTVPAIPRNRDVYLTWAGRVSVGDRDARLPGDAEDWYGERLGRQIDAAQPIIAVLGDLGWAVRDLLVLTRTSNASRSSSPSSMRRR